MYNEPHSCTTNPNALLTAKSMHQCYLIIIHDNLTLVVCLSTNGKRTLNYTIVKRLILTTIIQATKIKSKEFYKLRIRGKGDSMP